MRLVGGDAVVSCDVIRPDADLLLVTDGGFGKRTEPTAFPLRHRGGQGIRGIRTIERKGTVVAALMVADDDDVLLVSSNGVLIRTPVREISRQGRDATGVRVMNVTGDEVVAAVATVPRDDETSPEETDVTADGSTSSEPPSA